MPEGLLAGVRVVEIAGSVGAAYCGRLLAGLGADVTLVEPPEGNALRRLGPFPHGARDPELSAAHLHYHAAKRSVVLDDREQSDRDRLLGLVARTDVVLHSMTDAEAHGLGLDGAALRAANGAVVEVAVTPYGRTGPYAGRPGNELAAEALCGFASIHGEPPLEPLKLPGWQYECCAGTYAAIGAIAALLEGRARSIDVSTLEAGICFIESRLAGFAYNGEVPHRQLASTERWYPLNMFPTADGAVVLAFYHARDWENLVLALDDDALREDERFRTNRGRVKFRAELDAVLGPLLRARKTRDIFEATLDLRSAVGMVMDARSLREDPHLRERNAIVEVIHPVAGRYAMPGAPFITSDGTWRVAPAPMRGEHNGDQAPRPSAGVRGRYEPPASGGEPAFLPLAGVRVLDLTTAWAGPSATRVLGLLGADVIKVESCAHYDGWRGPALPPPPGIGAYADNDPGDRPYDRTPLFGTANRNKRAIALDLTSERGLTVFFRLVAKSDVVLSNFSARVLPNLGLDHARLASVNPDIISLSMPGYGATGPYANGTAYGNTNEAMSGMSSRFGYRDGPPQITHDLTYGDPVAGAHAAVAVLAALAYRRRSGHGMFIDLSQQETLLAQLGEGIVLHSLDGTVLGREGSKAFAFAPHGYYPAKGPEQWIAIAAETDAQWRALCDVLAAPELSGDPRFATADARLANQRWLDTAIAERTMLRDKRALADTLAEAGVAAAPVLRFDELASDPQINARDAFEDVDHASAGRRSLPRLPLTVDGMPLRTRRPTPLFAEHNRAVLAEIAGLTPEEIDALYEASIVGDLPVGARRVEERAAAQS